jgi:uncharacterized protein YkwD
MSRQTLIVSLLFLTVLAGSCSTESIEEIPLGVAESNPEMEQELLGLVNNHRTLLGYDPLSFSPVAYQYASSHTDYMIAKGSLNHDNFSARASGISAEVDAEYVAENVASHYSSAEQAFNNWLESPSHRKTMEGEFTHTAVSVKKDPGGKYYYTQLFFR